MRRGSKETYSSSPTGGGLELPYQEWHPRFVQLATIVIVWFPFVAAIVTYTLGTVALTRATGSRIVRAFALYALAQALLSFIEWGYRHASTTAAAQFWIDAGALWPLSVAAIWGLGWLVATGEDAGGKPLMSWLMLPPAVVFTVLGFLSPQMKRMVIDRWWGFTYTMEQSALMATSLLWALASGVIVGVLILIAYRKRGGRGRKLRRSFVRAILIVIAIGIFEALVQVFVPMQIPRFSTVGTVILVAMIGTAVSRHGMWEFAPSAAAETVLRTMGDAVLLVDDDGRVRYANAAAADMVGPSASLTGSAAAEVLPPSLLDEEMIGRSVDDKIETPNGGHLRVSVRVEPMPGGIGGRVIVLRDFEEQMRYQERLSYMAYHDALTGLGNRESFFHRLHSACATAGEPAYGVAACIILDVDHFKEINDAYGHAVGDEVLIQTAARLTEVTRSTDKAFRLGGDEFALVVREMRSRDDLALVVRKVFEAFRAPATIQTVSLPVSISMGYTVIEPSDSAESVYARADAGLYSAKTERGAAIEFTSDQELPQTRRAVLHRRVRDVVQAGSMHWHYQPIVKRDGSVVGAESLARWPQTDEPILSPAEFIPAAEETGLVWTIGTQARADAVGLMGRIAPDDFFISVNLSPRELLDDDLLERLLEQLGPSDAFSRIHLELTETQLMEFGPSQHRLFSALADAGARFLIDDFGTGYSSITRLRSLPVHGVKLDRSFLVDAHTDPRVRSVLEGAIRMVQGLGLELIAEGVESQDQVDFLSEAGCELFQGYYFHRPMTANELCKIVQCGTRPLNGRH